MHKHKYAHTQTGLRSFDDDDNAERINTEDTNLNANGTSMGHNNKMMVVGKQAMSAGQKSIVFDDADDDHDDYSGYKTQWGRDGWNNRGVQYGDELFR